MIDPSEIDTATPDGDPMITDSFLSAYIRIALWSTRDESDESGGEPLDANYSESDIAPSALERMKSDCSAFLAHPTVAEYLESDAFDSDYGRVAHNFWLTRNEHGTGFWDGDYPEPWGDRLTEAASFGECDLYLGDDDLIYCYP